MPQKMAVCILGDLAFFNTFFDADICEGYGGIPCELFPEIIEGCTDISAFNFNYFANLDDGSCIDYITDCMDETAFNFNPQANISDSFACYPVILGCTNTLAINFNNYENVEESQSLISIEFGGNDININTDNGSCIYECPPPWEVIVTDQNHSIFVTSAWLDQDGNELTSGSYLGVFYQNSEGQMVCAGYTSLMEGTEQIAVMGDDSSTEEIDGLSSGDFLQYIIWDSNACQEFTTMVSYSSGPEVYTSNGISFVNQVQISLGGPSQQNIIFPSGWSMFSTYIRSENTDISIVLEEIVEDIVIVKNNFGAAYLTEWSFNGIGMLMEGQGYQIKTYEIINFVIYGEFTSPESTPISLSQGWNMVGYLRTTGSSADLVLADLVADNVIIIAKDYNGNAYLPEFGFNGIGDMLPGQGYQIKTNESGTLHYLSDNVSYKLISGSEHK
jgi:hypothetical protein